MRRKYLARCLLKIDWLRGGDVVFGGRARAEAVALALAGAW